MVDPTANPVTVESESNIDPIQSEYEVSSTPNPYPTVCSRSLLKVEEQGPEDAEEEGDKWTADCDQGHHGEAESDQGPIPVQWQWDLVHLVRPGDGVACCEGPRQQGWDSVGKWALVLSPETEPWVSESKKEAI